MSNSSSGSRKLHQVTGDSANPQAVLDDLVETLRNAAAEVVWRQWQAIGGMAATRERARSLIDPEALVLMSLALEPEEPRLADLLADWVARNSDLLSVQRMRNLASRYPSAVRQHLGAIARVAVEDGKDHRWKPLIEAGGPVLIHRKGKPKAIRARALAPAALALRLRRALGVGIRADVVSFLLGMEENVWASIGLIAPATGYTVAAVRKAANDLLEARLIEQIVDTRAELRASQKRWGDFLEMREMAPWRGWNERFVFVAAFLEWAASARTRPLTPYSLASGIRGCLEAYPATFRWQRVLQEEYEESVKSNEPAAIVQKLARWMIDRA